jgi:SAM-dependent methyltransferase
MTFDAHRDLFDRLCARTVGVDVLLSAFDHFVASEAALRAELGRLTVKQLEGVARPSFSGLRKAKLVDLAHHQLLLEYLWLSAGASGCLSYSTFGSDLVAHVRRALEQLTAEQLELFVAAREKRRAEALARRAALVQAVTDPRTLEEFESFVRVRGLEALTAEQQTRRDELVSLKRREVEAEVTAKHEAAAGEAVGAIIDATHTKHHHAIYVVPVLARLGDDAFRAACERAKEHAGHYSSYRGHGATPGFTFREREKAEAFRSALLGSEVEAACAPNTATTKLQRMAGELAGRAEQNLAVDRLCNTARRAAMASRAEAQARADVQFARTLAAVAAAIESGEARHLGGLRERVQLEMLEQMLARAKHHELSAECPDYASRQARLGEEPSLDTVRFVEWPTFSASREELLRVGDHVAKCRGGIMAARRLVKLAQGLKDDVRTTVAPALAQTVLAKLAGERTSAAPWHWSEAALRLKRLERMGIDCIEQLRAACRELLSLRGERLEADRAAELERALVGTRVGVDFFPTPPALAAEMVARAGVRAGMRVLEPSAGNGNIAEQLRAAGAEVDTVEISTALRGVLEAKGFNLVGCDFLELEGASYDAIVMNPPFSNNADIAHVLHAWALLAPGGRLVSVVGEGAFTRCGELERNFRTWLEEQDAEVEQLPAGTFTDHRLLATTGANARLVVLRKAV